MVWRASTAAPSAGRPSHQGLLLLRKNNMLAEVVEKLKETQHHTISSAPVPAPAPALPLSYAGPEDVACDFCTERKQKALMSCLVCLASFCETHLQPRYKSPAFKKHTLLKASAQLQEKICSRHNKLLEVFCRTDQQCICHLCSMTEHKGHDTVSTAAEWTEKQTYLGISQQDIQQRVQEKDKELKELQQAVESFKHFADTAVEDSERIFTELIRSIERRHSEIKELIRAQQEAAVSQAEGLLEQLEQEIAELRRRHAEQEQLLDTEDHIHFLQSYQSLSSPSVSPDLPSILISPLQHFGELSVAVSKLSVKLEDILKGELPEISATVHAVGVLLPPEPKTRTWFLQYWHQLTLDPDTANKFLCLSKKKRKVTFTREVQPYPDHPERFTGLCQVLCQDGLSGHCYWEVEWTGQSVYIAVSYKDISKTGYNNETGFGYNERSWCLGYSNGEYWLRHNGVKTKVSGSLCSRVGVYLDHRAGILSFYNVSDTMTLLHRVQTTFTQALYPGFVLCGYGNEAELC